MAAFTSSVVVVCFGPGIRREARACGVWEEASVEDGLVNAAVGVNGNDGWDPLTREAEDESG